MSGCCAGTADAQLLDQLGDKAFVEAQVAAAGMRGAAAANEPRQVEPDLRADPTAGASRPVAQIATATLGRPVPLEVCYSAGGFYLGTYVDNEPYSRESAEYWTTREAAEAALAGGQWTQRQWV